MEDSPSQSGDPVTDEDRTAPEVAPDDAVMLFDDGLPKPDRNGGFKGAVAARAAGISYRQLDYWARTGLVEPTVRGAQGSGSQRLYGFRDILVLKLVKRLLDTGISLQQIRTAVAQLHEAGVHDLSQTTLMSDGASVYLCTSSDEVIDLMSRGQGVFGIAVGKVLREVESTLVDLDSHRSGADATDTDAVDELAARRRARKIS
ncbi:MerR family transcriptional regulator [Leucobacter sp. GX24907]